MASKAEEEYYPSPEELIPVMNIGRKNYSSLPSLGVSFRKMIKPHILFLLSLSAMIEFSSCSKTDCFFLIERKILQLVIN